MNTARLKIGWYAKLLVDNGRIMHFNPQKYLLFYEKRMKMELKGKKINFLGDSITEGVGTSSEDKIFMNRIKSLEGLSEARNYGIGGTRFAYQNGSGGYSEGVFKDVDGCFCNRFDKMDIDADCVVVFGGTNDFGHGDAPIGNMSDRTPDTFYGACHYLFSGLIKRYLGKPIVIMTPVHRLNENTPASKKSPVTLLDYVKVIREVAEYYGLYLLDLYASCPLQAKIPEVMERYMPDGLHPNDAGHEMIARQLSCFLKNI